MIDSQSLFGYLLVSAFIGALCFVAARFMRKPAAPTPSERREALIEQTEHELIDAQVALDSAQHRVDMLDCRLARLKAEQGMVMKLPEQLTPAEVKLLNEVARDIATLPMKVVAS